MASSSSSIPGENGLTPAQRLMQQHNTHQPTVEDVPDEADAPAAAAVPPTLSPIPQAPPQSAAPSEPAVVNGAPLSAKAAGKQRAQEPPLADVSNKQSTGPPLLDTQSEEAFPSLGPSKAKAPSASAWGSRPPSLVKNGLNGTARSNVSSPPSSAQASGTSTPYSALSSGPAAAAAPPKPAFGSAVPRGPVHQISLPGRYTEDMQMPASQLRKDLRKPYMDILREINKRSKAKVDMTSTNDFVTFRGQGPTQESVQQILKEVAAQIGKKEIIKVPVPSSLRAHIIGKQGSTIQSISKRSGARVQMPKADSSTPWQEDDDSMIDIDIEGNPIAVRLARNEIEAIVSQRTSTANLRLKEIPPEFFPFIAGPHNSRVNAFQDGRDVRVKVPHYHTWEAQAPPELQAADQPLSFRPQEGMHIQLSGDREAARQVQAEIEEQVNALRQMLTVRSLPGFESGHHQFIIGEQGAGLHDFLQETGCSIVLPPPSQDSEPITIIGPPDQIDEAMNKAMDLASSMQVTNVEVARQFSGPQLDTQNHARDFARYMRHRRALQRLEDEHSAQVMFPPSADSTSPWKIYTRDNRAGVRARVDVLNLANAHPPSRFRSVDLHPFYQRELEQQYARQLRDQHGVHVVVPEENDDSSRVLLVYENPGAVEDYVFPTKRPSAEEIAEFENALAAAEQALLELIGEQQDIVQRSLDAPVKYREKLSRYVNRDQQREPPERYPVQFFGLENAAAPAGESFPLEFHGPASAVEEYAEKLRAFIEEQIRDEAERDYKVTCDFPQKFANVLIGKKGENINKLRDEFDVEVQVKDGLVEIQGPKQKADAAKAHILSLARKLEDETTHVLKIDPKFHRELIGAKGSQVLKLQDRYNVRVTFPRSGPAPGDDESLGDGASDAGAPSKRRGPPQVADEVIIKGPRKGADEAKDELWALYQYMKDMSHTATVSVAQSQLASLIGQGGRELANLRESTGAEIDVPGSKDAVAASGRVDVKLKGRKDAVANAKKIIEAKAKAFDETVRRSVDVDKKHHGALIGSNGDNIRQIILGAGATGDAHELGQMVQFPKPHSEESSIRVEGSKDVVDKIVAAIESFAQVRESHVTEMMEVPADRHGALIGRGGQVRKGLESDHNITLFIPSTSATGPARSQVKITGMPADVEKTKERITALLNERKGETIMVPKRLHHAVSDGGAFFRVLSRDLRVTVDHQGQRPPKEETPTSPRPAAASMPLITDEAPGTPAEATREDVEAKLTWETASLVPPAPAEGDDPAIPWILKGDAESVDKAKALVAAAIAAAEQSVVGFLVLPDPKLHKSVIGPGGSTVNKIRKATHSKIDVPKAGESGAIEIRGAKDKVEEAKAMVVEAVLENLGRR